MSPGGEWDGGWWWEVGTEHGGEISGRTKQAAWPRALMGSVLFCLLSVAARAETAADIPPKTSWIVTASSVEKPGCEAAMACDGRNDTRWSSQWTDAEWLQIDLSRPAAVCGATIAWEDAFAAKYRILVSQDGTNWSTAYTAAEADGHTDEIFFAPVTARYVRVACEKRGTSWGCSIWEMDVKGPAERLIVEAPEGGGDGPDSMCDGRLDTQWISPTSGPAVATLDLRKTKPVAGIRIDWGKSYATRVRTSTSTDGTNWTAAGGIDDGTGQFDYILFPKTGARFVRLELQAPGASLILCALTLQYH